jgi:glycosyltransferase involved in cell wall biosynthesis
MIISIDASSLGKFKSGTSIYLFEILKIWNNDPLINHKFYIFANTDSQINLKYLNLNSKFLIITSPQNRYVRTFWQQFILPFYIYFLKVNVHWGPGFILPLFSSALTVLTVHDLSFNLFPNVHEWIKRYFFPVIIFASVKKAVSVITISETTQSDLLKIIPSSFGKTHVTYLASRSIGIIDYIDPNLLPSGLDDYILFVGTVEPRKNLDRLLDAWISLEPSVRGSTKLVIVGAKGWMVNNLFKRFDSIESIIFLDFVSDSILFQLLRHSKFLVYPSIYEGFGLPIIEAMSIGIPVLTSDIGATKEIAGGSAVLINPYSVKSIQDGLKILLLDQNLRRSLSELGISRAASFSWERTANLTLITLLNTLSIK